MSTGSMLERPPAAARARFAPGFGQRVLLTVDTEEEFDWGADFRREGHGLSHVPEIARFQQFCESIGAHPVYMVDWPIANDARAVAIIGDAVRRGRADVGIQLHPWVNPPFDEAMNDFNSYAGNLDPALEEAKFTRLRDQIEGAFGTPPLIYRAGRYGLGPHTAALLRKAGVRVDSSVRPLFDYRKDSGPDYSNHPLEPYWVGTDDSLIELPLTSVYDGVLHSLGPQIHRLQRHLPTFFSGLPRLRLLERLALTPEGVSVDEALRGIDIALKQGLPLLVLSFHSPTLASGHTPYAKTVADVERLYDWFRAVYARFDKRGVRSAAVADIIAAAQR